MSDIPLDFRHRAFAIADAVRERVSLPGHRVSFAWNDDTAIICRAWRNGRRYEYRKFPMDGPGSDAAAIEAMVAWMDGHAATSTDLG